MNNSMRKSAGSWRRCATTAALLLVLSGCDYFISAESRYERAQEFVAEGEYRRALIELKNALQKQPEMSGARILLADVALWLGDPASADRELRKAGRGDDPQRYADLEMRIDLALGRFQAVLDRLNGENAAAIAAARQAYYRGRALMGLRDAAAAEQQFRTALQADAAFVEAKVALGESLAAQNALPQAVDTLAGVVAEHPDSALAWHTRGTVLARRGASAEAEQALERALALAPKRLEFIRQIALLAELTELRLASGKVEQARATNAQLAKLAPGSPIALLMASRISMAANDYATASADLRRVVNANPQIPQARFLLGVTLLAQGNLQQAAQELSAAVEQMPENMEARQLLAQVRMRQEDPDGAMSVLVPALQSGADDWRLTSLMDTARAKAGSSARTIEMLERALRETPGNQALHLQLASSYLQSGEAEKALELLRKAPKSTAGQREAMLLQAITEARGNASARSEVEAMIVAHPADPALISLAAAFYSHIGDVPEARRVLLDALKGDPRNAQVLFTLAQLEWSARRPAEARDALNRVLAMDSKHAAARLTLAQLDLATGNVEAARSGLEILRKDDPRAWLSRLLLARLALIREDAKEAELLIAEAAKATSDPARLHDSAGMLYLDSGRYDQAIAHFRQAADANPSDPALWLNLGRAQQALGMEEPARESLGRALTLRPNWVAAEGVLAFIELQAGEREAALQRIARVQNSNPRDPAALVLAGEVHAAARGYAEAARAFDAAGQIRPSGLLALKTYQARRAAQQPQAVEPLQQWVERNPDDLASRNALADAYALEGQRDRAVEQYERIIAAQPANVAALNNLAWIYFESNDSRAEQTARKAHALAPKVPAVADTLGWILVHSDRLPEGLKLLEGAVASAGANAEIRYHYAVALARSGSQQSARAELDRLLSEHGDFASRSAAQQLHDTLAAGNGA